MFPTPTPTPPCSLSLQMLAYRQAQRPVPPELREQYQDIARRSQLLRSRLQHGDPPFRKGEVSA